MLKPPTKATLKKYGLTEQEWLKMAEVQNNKCPICERFLEDVKVAIDHYHFKNWKKLQPEERKKYVRGLLCVYDNFRLLPKGITTAKAKNIAIYLENFDQRSPMC